MKLFHNKKGGIEGLQLEPLLVMMFIFLILVILFNIAAQYGDSTYLNRIYVGKNVGFIVETLKFAPGDVLMRYPDIIKDIKLEVDSSKVASNSLHYIDVLNLYTYGLVGIENFKVMSFIYPKNLDDDKNEVVFGLIFEKTSNSINLHSEDQNE